ncbi:MAG: GNAT family N-acetyltransferase [Acetobacteraceae bacterium]
MVPVGWADLPDLQALKSDPRVFAVMFGGVRTVTQVADELAQDIAFWAARGCGIWSVRAADAFLGITGFMERPDGRGVALRFALWPDARGQGLAREAAGAALRFGHDRAGLSRIVAIARETNVASRTVLGGIGMIQADKFLQDGHAMVLYESVRP